MGNHMTGERINRKEYNKIEDNNEVDTGYGKKVECGKGGGYGKGNHINGNKNDSDKKDSENNINKNKTTKELDASYYLLNCN